MLVRNYVKINGFKIKMPTDTRSSLRVNDS